MEIEIAGPWVLLFTGVVLVLMGGASRAFWPGKATRAPWVLIFGFGIAGVGVYGMEFLNTYRYWVPSLVQFMDNPTQEGFENVVEKLNDGTIPEEARAVVVPALAERLWPGTAPEDFDTTAALNTLNTAIDREDTAQVGRESLQLLSDLVTVRMTRDEQLTQLEEGYEELLAQAEGPGQLEQGQLEQFASEFEQLKMLGRFQTRIESLQFDPEEFDPQQLEQFRQLQFDPEQLDPQQLEQFRQFDAEPLNFGPE